MLPTGKKDVVANLFDELPEPTATDLDGLPFWQLSDGQRVYAKPDSGDVYTPSGTESLEVIEWDALVMLAAVAWARGQHRAA